MIVIIPQIRWFTTPKRIKQVTAADATATCLFSTGKDSLEDTYSKHASIFLRSFLGHMCHQLQNG